MLTARLVLCLLVAGVVAAAADPASPVAQARAAIAAADAARSTDAAEADAMARDRARAEAAIDLLAARTAAEERRIAELEERLAALAEERADLDRRDAERFAWREPLAAIHGAGRERLARLAARLPPGVLPPPGADAGLDDDPVQALLALRRRIRAGLDAAGAWSLGVVEGRLDGEARAVNLLRCGGVAAWWRALEGKRAGTARVVDGTLLLTDAADERSRRAIASAIAIAGGRATPVLLDLPLDPAEVTP